MPLWPGHLRMVPQRMAFHPSAHHHKDGSGRPQLAHARPSSHYPPEPWLPSTWCGLCCAMNLVAHVPGLHLRSRSGLHGHQITAGGGRLIPILNFRRHACRPTGIISLQTLLLHTMVRATNIGYPWLVAPPINRATPPSCRLSWKAMAIATNMGYPWFSSPPSTRGSERRYSRRSTWGTHGWPTC